MGFVLIFSHLEGILNVALLLSLIVPIRSITKDNSTAAAKHNFITTATDRGSELQVSRLAGYLETDGGIWHIQKKIYGTYAKLVGL